MTIETTACHDRRTENRYRLTLEAVATRTTPIALEELAAAVAERGRSDDASAAVERVAIELHHTQLPGMADRGLLDYDSERRLVESVE